MRKFIYTYTEVIISYCGTIIWLYHSYNKAPNETLYNTSSCPRMNRFHIWVIATGLVKWAGELFWALPFNHGMLISEKWFFYATNAWERSRTPIPREARKTSKEYVVFYFHHCFFFISFPFIPSQSSHHRRSLYEYQDFERKWLPIQYTKKKNLVWFSTIVELIHQLKWVQNTERDQGDVVFTLTGHKPEASHTGTIVTAKLHKCT